MSKKNNNCLQVYYLFAPLAVIVYLSVSESNKLVLKYITKNYNLQFEKKTKLKIF